MGAKRDSNYPHNYPPSVDFFWFILHVTSLSVEELFLLYNGHAGHANTGSMFYKALLCYKARNPMIGARKRASALCVVLIPAFVFCAIASVA